MRSSLSSNVGSVGPVAQENYSTANRIGVLTTGQIGCYKTRPDRESATSATRAVGAQQLEVQDVCMAQADRAHRSRGDLDLGLRLLPRGAGGRGVVLRDQSDRGLARRRVSAQSGEGRAGGGLPRVGARRLHCPCRGAPGGEPGPGVHAPVPQPDREADRITGLHDDQLCRGGAAVARGREDHRPDSVPVRDARAGGLVPGRGSPASLSPSHIPPGPYA